MSEALHNCRQAHSIVYEGTGSYDHNARSAYYSIIIPAREQNRVTVDSRIYNISRKDRQAILLWMTTRDNTDMSAETNVAFEDIRLNLERDNIFPYEAGGAYPEIDLSREEDIEVVVYHNDTLEGFGFLQPQKYGMGILRKGK